MSTLTLVGGPQDGRVLDVPPGSNFTRWNFADISEGMLHHSAMSEPA